MQHWAKSVGGRRVVARSIVESLENRRLLAAELDSLITFGDPNDVNRGNAVAVDADGNVYVAGAFRDEAAVPSGGKRPRVIRSHGDDDYDDAFLLKYSLDGSLIWARTFGGAAGNDGIRHIAIDADGDVIVAGYFVGTVDFAPGKGVFNLKGYGDRDGFIAKFTAEGRLDWAGHVGSRRDDEITALGVGVDGDVYVAGTIRLDGDVDPTPRVRRVTTRGVDDTFISRLDGDDGGLRWFRQFGEENTREGVNGLVVGGGSVYVTGTFNRTVEFDRDGRRRFTLTQEKYDDAYLGSLSLEGEWEWLGTIASEEREEAAAIALGPGGDIYVTGSFGASADFEFGKGETILRPEGEDDVYVARYAPDGGLLWARNFGEAADDGRVRSTSIAVDDDGFAYVAGMFHEEIDFDPSGRGRFIQDAEKDDAPPFSIIGATDAFVLKLNDNGRFVDVTRTGGSDGSAVPYDIAVIGGSIFTTGQFGGSIDFEPGSGRTRRRTDDDGDEADVFIWKLVDN